MPSVLARIDDDLTLRVPQFFCCNCGEAEEIRSVATPLNRTGSWKPGGRFAFQLDLPYCRCCARTATRRPVGAIKKAIIAGILSLAAGVLAMITPLASIVGAWAFYLIAVPVFAIVYVGYARQKPKGKQTSYHQPVRIVQVNRQFGKVSALTLAFSHARYAQTFASANKEEVARGVLEIEGG